MNVPSFFIIYLCWFIAFVASIGSLFFSEVMEFPPCVLCWYQRIAMYPLVIIFFVARNKKTMDAINYGFPFVLLGWVISLYHNLLHYEIVPENISPCREGVSCSTVYIEIFDFLTIPMMSFIAFSLIGTLLIILKRKSLNEK